MFTHGEHVDVFDYHHLIVVFIEDGVVQYVWGEKWERLNIKEKSFCLNLTVTWIFCSIPCLVDWLFTFCDHADLFCRRGFLLLFGLNFKKQKQCRIFSSWGQTDWSEPAMLEDAGFALTIQLPRPLRWTSVFLSGKHHCLIIALHPPSCGCLIAFFGCRGSINCFIFWTWRRRRFSLSSQQFLISWLAICKRERMEHGGVRSPKQENTLTCCFGFCCLFYHCAHKGRGLWGWPMHIFPVATFFCILAS